MSSTEVYPFSDGSLPTFFQPTISGPSSLHPHDILRFHSQQTLTRMVVVQTVVLKVAMTCGGCVGAVKRAIGKLDGVNSYDIDLQEQKVTVTGNVKPDEVLDRISRTGKATSFWAKDDKSEVAAA